MFFIPASGHSRVIYVCGILLQNKKYTLCNIYCDLIVNEVYIQMILFLDQVIPIVIKQQSDTKWDIPRLI